MKTLAALLLVPALSGCDPPLREMGVLALTCMRAQQLIEEGISQFETYAPFQDKCKEAGVELHR